MTSRLSFNTVAVAATALFLGFAAPSVAEAHGPGKGYVACGPHGCIAVKRHRPHKHYRPYWHRYHGYRYYGRPYRAWRHHHWHKRHAYRHVYRWH